MIQTFLTLSRMPKRQNWWWKVVDVVEFKTYISCGGLEGTCTHSIRETNVCKNEKCKRIFENDDIMFKDNYNVQLDFDDIDKGIEHIFAWRCDLKKLEAEGETLIEKLSNGVVTEKNLYC